MLILVTYDVSNRRALRRTARLMNTFGTRVQKSVFECHLSRGQFAHLLKRLREERKRAPAGTLYSARCYMLGTLPPDRLVVVGDGDRISAAPFHIV